MIDIGSVVHGMVVEEVAFDQPGAWWLSCGHGHKVFATTRMLESGPVACKECHRCSGASKVGTHYAAGARRFRSGQFVLRRTA
jgi:hypothetical protein